LGILTVALAGGYLFDNVSKAGPFVFVGAMNVVLLIWAIQILLKNRRNSLAAD
jgi:hypothetical protein